MFDAVGEIIDHLNQITENFGKVEQNQSFYPHDFILNFINKGKVLYKILFTGEKILHRRTQIMRSRCMISCW